MRPTSCSDRTRSDDDPQENLSSRRDTTCAVWRCGWRTRRCSKDGQRSNKQHRRIRVAPDAAGRTDGCRYRQVRTRHFARAAPCVVGGLRQLVVRTRAIESGTDSEPLSILTRDEVGELALAFNRMVEELRSRERIKDT